MRSFDYIEWWNRRPVWLRIALVPILVPVMLLHSLVVMAFLLLVYIPYRSIADGREDRRRMRRLRKQGRIVEWEEVESRILSGAGTLLVEIFPKGFGKTWFLDRARDEIDPERIVPSVETLMTHGWDAAFAEIARIDRWQSERLPKCAGTACIVEGVPSAIIRSQMVVQGWGLVSMFAADD